MQQSRLQFDKLKIDDGTTVLQASVERGGEVLEAGELAKLQLSIKRIKGTAVTLAGNASGALKFANTNSLILSSDRKSAYTDLTITPGTDQEAAFEVGLIDGQGDIITSTIQEIEWSSGARLEITNATYDATAKEVTVEIKNSGKLKLGSNQATLTWDTGDDKIKIGGVRSGSKGIDAIGIGVSDTILLNSIVFSDSAATSSLEIKVKWSKLGSDVIATIALAENEFIAQALQGKQQAGDAYKEVSKALLVTNLVGARAAVTRAKTYAQKAADAVAVLGVTGNSTHPATKAAQAARKAADDAKNEYDTEEKVKIKEAQDGQQEAEEGYKEVNKALGATNFVGAKAAVTRAAAGSQKAEAAVKALGVAGDDQHLATQAAKEARKAADQARKSTHIKAKSKVEEAQQSQQEAEKVLAEIVAALKTTSLNDQAIKDKLGLVKEKSDKAADAVTALEVAWNDKHAAVIAARAAAGVFTRAEDCIYYVNSMLNINHQVEDLLKNINDELKKSPPDYLVLLAASGKVWELARLASRSKDKLIVLLAGVDTTDHQALLAFEAIEANKDLIKNNLYSSHLYLEKTIEKTIEKVSDKLGTDLASALSSLNWHEAKAVLEEVKNIFTHLEVLQKKLASIPSTTSSNNIANVKIEINTAIDNYNSNSLIAPDITKIT